MTVDSNENLEISECDDIIEIVGCHNNLKGTINIYLELSKIYQSSKLAFSAAMSLNDISTIKQALLGRLSIS